MRIEDRDTADEAEHQRLMREASNAFAQAASEGRTARRPAPMALCGECGCSGECHDLLDDEGECLECGRCPGYQPRTARVATIAGAGGSYTSEPIPGRSSAFTTSDGTYYANAEDCRRAQKILDELATVEAQLTALGDAAAERLARRIA